MQKSKGKGSYTLCKVLCLNDRGKMWYSFVEDIQTPNGAFYGLLFCRIIKDAKRRRMIRKYYKADQENADQEKQQSGIWFETTG